MYANPNLVYGTILVSPNNTVLLIKGRRTGKWSFPKGHSEQGETEIDCALRETYEETGIELSYNFSKIVHLATGVYFLYYMSEEICKPIDTKEVMETSWVSLQAMKHMSVNVDINTVLRSYSKLVC